MGAGRAGGGGPRRPRSHRRHPTLGCPACLPPSRRDGGSWQQAVPESPAPTRDGALTARQRPSPAAGAAPGAATAWCQAVGSQGRARSACKLGRAAAPLRAQHGQAQEGGVRVLPLSTTSLGLKSSPGTLLQAVPQCPALKARSASTCCRSLQQPCRPQPKTGASSGDARVWVCSHKSPRPGIAGDRHQ